MNLSFSSYFFNHFVFIHLVNACSVQLSQKMAYETRIQTKIINYNSDGVTSRRAAVESVPHDTKLLAYNSNLLVPLSAGTEVI